MHPSPPHPTPPVLADHPRNTRTNRRTTTPQDTHTHTHTRHTDETPTCTTGGGGSACVPCVVWCRRAAVRQKKRIFGLLVTEASRRFALFCSPFSSRLHSVGFWLGCLLAVVTRPWLELHRAKQKKSGETGLEIK